MKKQFRHPSKALISNLPELGEFTPSSSYKAFIRAAFVKLAILAAITFLFFAPVIFDGIRSHLSVYLAAFFEVAFFAFIVLWWYLIRDFNGRRMARIELEKVIERVNLPTSSVGHQSIPASFSTSQKELAIKNDEIEPQLEYPLVIEVSDSKMINKLRASDSCDFSFSVVLRKLDMIKNDVTRISLKLIFIRQIPEAWRDGVIREAVGIISSNDRLMQSLIDSLDKQFEPYEWHASNHENEYLSLKGASEGNQSNIDRLIVRFEQLIDSMDEESIARELNDELRKMVDEKIENIVDFREKEVKYGLDAVSDWISRKEFIMPSELDKYEKVAVFVAARAIRLLANQEQNVDTDREEDQLALI